MLRVAREKISLGPQPGPQYQFTATEADIAIYGGAAGGGKSYGLLIDPMRHYTNKLFGGVIFRRTGVQVRNEGGLWDESMGLYSKFQGRPREATLEWRFPTGMSMSFAHLEHEKDVLNWQGSQIPWLGFDELTHFSQTQFFYMISRNRSASGVKPKIRATCNPDPDSWVKTFIRWWLDEKGEFPILERSGKLRWFIRRNDEIVWANTKEELHQQFGNGPEIIPKSVTFIAAKLEDNKILMEKDPAYMGNLLALNRVDRQRLKDGNWNARATAGELFKREWFPIVDAIPEGFTQVIRFWDRAASRPTAENPDPDWTRGLKLYKYPNGKYVVGDLKSLQDTPGQVENFVFNVASHDGYSIRISAQQDPGSAGVSEAEHFIRLLAGYYVTVEPFYKDKVTRAKPVSAQAEWHNILVLRAEWNEAFFNELENFGEGSKGHDDIVDTLSGAFNCLSEHGKSIADV